MDAKDLIRQVCEREPLNPYQLAGMASVIDQAGIAIEPECRLEMEQASHVLMILDRTGEEAASHLIDLKRTDSVITLSPRFPLEALEPVETLTSFPGRRQAIREHLIPALYEIPNWLDLVKSIARYALDRDDESLGEQLDQVMEVLLGFLFAAACQPFDREARSEGEYTLSRLVESILKSAGDTAMIRYVPYVERMLAFLTNPLFETPLNTFERRMIAVFGIQAALKKSDGVRARLQPMTDKLAAQAVITALGEIQACPDLLMDELVRSVQGMDRERQERFRSEVLERIRLHCADEVRTRVQLFQDIREGKVQAQADTFRAAVDFLKSHSEDWKKVLAAFEDMIDGLPEEVQDAFAEILAVQILSVQKPDVKQTLIDGICRIVVRLERARKKASRDLVHTFVGLFLDRAYTASRTSEKISSLRALESLGVTLGRHGYYLMAQELLDQLLERPLIMPEDKRYTIEDDDTGEPLVLAESMEGSRAHVQHMKSLMAIIASNPRIMHRLIPYLTVQIEMVGVRLCDEDFIQYWISSLLRSNSATMHFPVRTLIKAIPYSFKDIGPLDTLRLTAASLAKELADRGVKPIGNFLGKLRGDIHWRGSIENFYFCQAIIKFFATGDPAVMSEWMPRESMPYLKMSQWCSQSESQAIQDLCLQIFERLGVDLSERDGMLPLVSADTAVLQSDIPCSEFVRRVVFNVIDLLQGLHHKYFVVHESVSGRTLSEDMDRLNRVVKERREFKERFLNTDSKEPVPKPVTLTEGSGDHLREIERITRERPGTPIVLRAKKAGHAYAQKATYLEEEFEAFNKDLQLESLQETLATTINNTHFEQITEENFPYALPFVHYLVKGVAVNGHSSFYLEQAGRDLKDAGPLKLTFDKIRDLVGVIQKELDDIYELYRRSFEQPFDDCLNVCSMDRLPRKLIELTTLRQVPETDFFRNYLKTLYISDLQARDGNLRVLEIFVEKLEMFLNLRLAESGRIAVPTETPIAQPVSFYFPDQGPKSPCEIGLKASLLRFATNTPPYFVVTTAHSSEPEKVLADPDFGNGFIESVKRLEKTWGKKFGDPSNPALFSVRSGSRISMPGMMITLTNVGINDQIAAGLAENLGTWFAYDCYRRFLQEFGQSVYGMDREEFQDIIDERKTKWRAPRKAQMSGDQMKQLAFDYKTRVAQFAPEAIELVDKGRFMDILIRSAIVVMKSYDTRAAMKYRQAAGIAGNWGSPAIVQAMVYGNREVASSGTGVVAYNPFSLELRGDFSLGDQGTDVVDGKVVTIPVYDLWKTEESMASMMPAQWKSLHEILRGTAERLHFHVSLEYTVEKGQVFVLQVRKQREKTERVPDLKDTGYKVLARGTGVSGSIFRGILVTDRAQIAPYRHIAKAQSIIDAMNKELPETDRLDGFIFVVNDPIPEEVMEEIFSLPVESALISRLGGRGAHVADIAKALKKVYVGQIRQIHKFSGRPPSIGFGERQVVVGSKLVIHGQSGEIALYGEK